MLMVSVAEVEDPHAAKQQTVLRRSEIEPQRTGHAGVRPRFLVKLSIHWTAEAILRGFSTI